MLQFVVAGYAMPYVPSMRRGLLVVTLYFSAFGGFTFAIRSACRARRISVRVLHGDERRRRSGRDTQFVIDVFDVVMRGAFRHHQLGANLTIG
jgi:hypothetical protein